MEFLVFRVSIDSFQNLCYNRNNEPRKENNMKRENLFKNNLDSECIIDHEEFVLRRESDELTEKRNELDNRLGEEVKKTIQKGLFFFAGPLFGLILGILFAVIAVDEYLKTNTLQPLPTLFAVLSLCAALVIFLISKKKHEEIDPKFDNLDHEYGDLTTLSKTELHVPENAPTIEIFTDLYSEEDNESDGVYTNEETTVFEENGMLCFYYGSAVIGFPLSEIEAIVKTDLPIFFSSWDKEVPYDGDEYAQYNIQLNKIDKYNENYTMTGYYSLRFTHSGTPFEVVIPPYEIAPVLEILKIEPITE